MPCESSRIHRRSISKVIFISTLCHISAHSAFSPILSTDASAFTTASNQPSIKAVCISLFSASRAQQLFLSSLYLVAVGISFNDLNYDFRQLKVFRFMPLLWSIALILLVMQDAVSFESNVDEILKQILLVCGMCFFYRFASETLAQDNESAGRATVLFGRLYSYIAAVYFIDRLMLLFSQKTAVSDFDGIFSVSALLICTFVFFFERNIVANEN